MAFKNALSKILEVHGSFQEKIMIMKNFRSPNLNIMKTSTFILSFVFILGLSTTQAQEFNLTHTDTIPEYGSKIEKLKIHGTIYQSDGVTPASDVIFYIEQADENGDFQMRGEKGDKYVYHSGTIKTDAEGKYTFFTFVPGNDRRYNQLSQLYPAVKEPSKPAYFLPTLLFDNDPLLTRKCRKRMAKKDDVSRILKPKSIDGLLVVEKDIVLPEAVNQSR